MEDHKQKEDGKEKGKGSTLGTIAKRMVVGAGIAVAGAAVLRNEKNRAKLKEAVANAKNRVNDYLDEVDDKVDDQEVELNQKIGEAKKTVKKATKRVKKQIKS